MTRGDTRRKEGRTRPCDSRGETFVRSFERSFVQVRWTSESRRSGPATDREALTAPNLEWAFWVLDGLLALGEAHVARELDHRARRDRGPREPLPASRAAVFSAGFFGTLLDAARGNNLALRELALSLCGRAQGSRRVQNG